MRKLIFSLIILTFCSSAVGLNYDQYYYMRHMGNVLSGNVTDPIYLFMGEVGGLVGGNIGTGDILYVDSNVTSEGNGKSWVQARDTIEEAYDLVSANNGDVIYVAQDHAETLGTLVLDTEGVTIIGCGRGEDRPEITFNGTGDIITISGASNALVNLSFRAGVHAITTGINITADGDYTTIWGCDFPEPADNTYDFITAIQLAGASDYVTVAYNTYKHADAVGPAEFVDTGATACQGLSVIGNYVYGEFSVSAIFSDQTDLEMFIADNVITNMTNNLYAIQVGASATGWLVNNKVATNTYATGIEAGGLAVDESTTWVDYGQTDIVAVPYFANTTGVARMSATEAAEVEAEVEDAIQAATALLDHLVAVADADDVVDSSIMAHLAASDEDWSGFDPTTDSLEAIRDAITALTGVGFRGDATSGTTSTWVGTDLAGFGDNFFNTNWKMIITYDAGDAGAIPEGDVRDIVAYTSTTGAFTVAPNFSAAVGAGDKAYIVRDQDMNPHDTTILGGSDKITYVDSGVAGTADVGDLGDTWDLAYPTITAALDAAVTSGEVIYVAPGHSETVSAAYSIDDAGVSIIGLGEGSLQPLITFDNVDAQLDITVADVLIQNIRIESQLDDVKIGIDISDTGDGAHIKNCNFTNETSSDELLVAIELMTDSDDVIIEGCTFLSTGAASTEAIKVITGACDNLQILNNWIRGDYTVAAIWSDQALTDLLIKGNVVHQETASQHAIELTSTAVGAITDNRLYADTYASILDPGSCLCTGNLAVDALDQHAIAIPLSAETTDVTAVADGSDLERLEYLQDKTDDILAGIRMAGGSVGDVYYVDSVAGNSSNDGTTWAAAEDTLANGYGDCTASVGDIVFLSPAHAENINGATSLSTAGVTVIGLGEYEERPTLTFTATASSLDIGAANNVIDNIICYSSTADSTIGIDIKDAGDGCVIKNCAFTNASGFEFVSAIEYSDDADNVTVENCRFINTGGAEATEAIKNTAGTTIGMRLIGNYIYGAYDAAGIFSDDIDTLCEVRDNIVHNTQTGEYAIEFSAAATGDCIDNLMYADTVNVVLDPGSMICFGNKAANAIDTGAIDVPLIPGKTYALTNAAVGEGDADLFDVAGGSILITSFTGLITETIGGAAETTSISFDGVDDFLFSTAVDTTAWARGSRIIFTAANNAVLTELALAGVGSGNPMYPWFCPVGMIEVVDGEDNAQAGAVSWSMTFIPLTTGVTVTVE